MGAQVGFRNAPTSKALFIFVAVFTLLVSLTGTRVHMGLDLVRLLSRLELWRLVSHHFVLSSPGELLLSLVLIYRFRIFERQSSAVKHTAYLLTTLFLATVLQVSVLAVTQRLGVRALLPGPYGYIFACLVKYYFDTPVTNVIRVGTLFVSDKFLAYAIALQLLLSCFPHSMLAGLCGVGAGLVYRSDLGGIARKAPPVWFARLFGKLVGPCAGAVTFSAVGPIRQFVVPNAGAVSADTVGLARDLEGGAGPGAEHGEDAHRGAAGGPGSRPVHGGAGSGALSSEDDGGAGAARWEEGDDGAPMDAVDAMDAMDDSMDPMERMDAMEPMDPPDARRAFGLDPAALTRALRSTNGDVTAAARLLIGT